MGEGEKVGLQKDEAGGTSRRQFLARGSAFAFAAAVTGPGLTLLSGCGACSSASSTSP